MYCCSMYYKQIAHIDICCTLDTSTLVYLIDVPYIINVPGGNTSEFNKRAGPNIRAGGIRVILINVPDAISVPGGW